MVLSRYLKVRLEHSVMLIGKGILDRLIQIIYCNQVQL